MPTERVDRRRFLAAAGAGAAGAVAGCLGGGGDSAFEIEVGPGGNPTFDPEAPGVQPGTTVKFIWQSGGHNIVVTSQPEDADWGGVEEQQDEGFEHEHTFEVEGQYEFVSEPDRQQGMFGVLVVSEDAGEDG